MVSINWAAVIVCGIISMAIGALWYSPVMFGNIWMQLSGISEADIQKDKRKSIWKSYLIQFAGTLLMSYVLAYVIKYSGAVTFMEGAIGGFWIWLGFIVPVLIGTVLWENKPVKLYLLNVGQYLVVLTFTGGILAVWV